MVNYETIILSLVAALIGSATGGIINYYLQKSDKKVGFVFESKKEVYQKIEDYLDCQNLLVSELISRALKQKSVSEEEKRKILEKILKNMNEIKKLIYRGVKSEVIHRKIKREFIDYEEEIFSMKNRKMKSERIFLRTNKHINKIRKIIKKELLLK